VLSTQPAALQNAKAEEEERLPSEDIIVAEGDPTGIEIIRNRPRAGREVTGGRGTQSNSISALIFPFLGKNAGRSSGFYIH